MQRADDAVTSPFLYLAAFVNLLITRAKIVEQYKELDVGDDLFLHWNPISLSGRVY